MKYFRMLMLIAVAAAFTAPAYAQSAGDKANGQGGTNGQQSPSTDTSSGSSGTGQH